MLHDPSIIELHPVHCPRVERQITVERVVRLSKVSHVRGDIHYKGLYVHVKRMGNLDPNLPRYQQTWTSYDPGRERPLLRVRHLATLKLLCQPIAPQEIADRLCISLSTYKNYTAAIHAALGVNSRLEAVLWALKSGIVSLDEIELHTVQEEQA